MKGIKGKKKFLIYFFIMGILLAHFFFHQKHYSPQVLFDLLNQHPVAAPFYFLCIYIIGIVTMIPTLPLNLLAGVFFGVGWGALLSTLGSGIGSIFAFLLARTLWGQTLIKRVDSKWLIWLERELAKESWKVVAFVRLFPTIPSGPANYIFGLTNIRFLTYAWSTTLFLFFPALIFSLIGHSVGLMMLGSGELTHLLKLTILGLTGFCVFTFGFPYLWKKRMKRLG